MLYDVVCSSVGNVLRVVCDDDVEYLVLRFHSKQISEVANIFIGIRYVRVGFELRYAKGREGEEEEVNGTGVDVLVE